MYTSLLKYSSILFAIFALSSDLFAQNIYRVESADDVTQRVRNGQTVLTAKGNVHMIDAENNANVYCDELVNYRDSGFYILKGNVQFEDADKILSSQFINYDEKTGLAVSPGEFYYEDSTGVLTAETGQYDYKKDILRAEGKVYYRSDVRELRSRTLEYFKEEEKANLVGDIHYIDNEQHAIAFGDTADLNLKDDYGKIYGSPRLIIADTSSTDSLYINGEIMEYFGGDSSKFIVTDQVDFMKGELSGTCNKAEFNETSSMIYLRIQPEIFSDDTRMTGDEIDLYLKDKEPEKVVVTNNAVAYTAADSTGNIKKDNELKGKTLTLLFEDKIIYRVIASQNAESLYYIVENGKLMDVHTVSGEQIILDFKDGKVKKITAENDIRGKYLIGTKKGK